MRSLNVPGSPSAPFTTTVVGSRPEALSRTVRHLTWVGNPAPPRPRRPAASSSSMMASGSTDMATSMPRPPRRCRCSSSDRTGAGGRTRCTTVMAGSLPQLASGCQPASVGASSRWPRSTESAISRRAAPHSVGRAGRYVLVARPDLIGGDAVLPPHRAFGRVVQHQRGQSVERRRKPRLARLAGLELVPERPEPIGLVDGQQAEDPVRGRLFAARPCRRGRHRRRRRCRLRRSRRCRAR